MLRGWAQRGGRALQQRKTRAVGGGDMARAQGETILRSAKEPHLVAKGKPEKRQVLTRLLTGGGQLSGVGFFREPSLYSHLYTL